MDQGGRLRRQSDFYQHPLACRPAYPDAAILAIGERGLEPTTYEESYIYRDVEAFISNVPLIQRELGLLD